MTDEPTTGDALAVIRAYTRHDPAAFELLLPGEHDDLLLLAFGTAVQLLEEATKELSELDPERPTLEVVLQRAIEGTRE